MIGGPNPGDANVIAASGDAGISLSSSSNTYIESNFIGTNTEDSAGMGNATSGVAINIGTANRINRNNIVNNGGLGIELNPDGVTVNDPGDGDTGANNLQNFPVLTSATRSGSQIDIQGTLDSMPNALFRVEYFFSSVCDPSLNGEGQKFVDVDNVTTDAAGHAGISRLVNSSFLFDLFVTATATDQSGNTSEFSACVPILEMVPSPTPTPTPSPTPTPGPTPSILQFGEAAYSVTEDCTEVIVSVSRTGDISQAASVDYSTLPGTASDRSDFITALGTLNFATGETAVSFVVLINEDSLVEGTEIASLVLSNPSGATLGTQSSAVLEIFDDPPEPAANAIDVAEQFVAQHYHDFLNRQHDVSGLNFWTNQIESCGTDLTCIQLKRVNVSAAFFLSIEFQETGFFAIRTQRAAFARKSDNSATRLTYLQFLRQARQVGDGLIVGAPGWQQKLEANRQAYAEKTAASAEFITLYPLSMTAAEYVDALFASSGVAPTSGETQDALTAFGGGGLAGRTAALRKVVDSPSLRNAEFREAFVLMQYFGYLRRNPTDAPDTDDGGYQFWLSKLNQFNGDFVAAEMVRAFINSTEYRQRFGQP